MTILDTARRVLESERKAAAGPLIINRNDDVAGIISYQLQQDHPPGDVLCDFSDDDCKRARASAAYVADVYTAGPDLARFALLVETVLRECTCDVDDTEADRAINGTIRVIRARLGLDQTGEKP